MGTFTWHRLRFATTLVLALPIFGLISIGQVWAQSLRVYLAGPLGFSEAGRTFYYDTLIPELARLRYQILDPWALTDKRKIDKVVRMPLSEEKREAWKKLNEEIGRNNKKAIDKSDVLLAILDGSDVDSGTAAEIGYAFGRGKRILGYRGDFRLSADNEGSVVNVQVEYFILASGGQIVRHLYDLWPALAKLRSANESR